MDIYFFHFCVLLEIDLSLIFHLSTITFGYYIVQIILWQKWKNPYQILAGWLFGSILTSYFLFFLTYFIQMTKFLVYAVIIIQILIAIISKLIIDRIQYRNEKIKSKVLKDEPYSIYILLFIIGFISFIYLNSLYNNSSQSKIAFSVISVEKSISNSIIYGANTKRKHFFTIENPLLSNSVTHPYIINYYIAACTILNSSYENTSIFICFMNTISSVAFFFYYIKNHTTHSIILTFLFFSNCGWAFIRYIFSNNHDFDFVHEIDRYFPIPSYQIIVHILSLPKHYSFSVALSFLSLSLISTGAKNVKPAILAGISAALIPSPIVSAAIFLYGLIFENSWKSMNLFSFVLIFKFIGSNVQFKPIWTSYLNDGLYFAAITAIFEILGYSALGLIRIFTNSDFSHKTFAALSISLVSSIFIEGNDYYSSSVVFQCLLLPILYINMLSIGNISSNEKLPKISGILKSIFLILLCFQIIGTGNCMNKTISNVYHNNTQDDNDLSNIIREKVGLDDLVLASPQDFYIVSSLAGKTVFISDYQILYQNSLKYSQKIIDYEQILKSNTENDMKRFNIKFILQTCDNQTNKSMFNLSNSYTIISQYKNYQLLAIN